jgi:hypothetical protein
MRLSDLFLWLVYGKIILTKVNPHKVRVLLSLIIFVRPLRAGKKKGWFIMEKANYKFKLCCWAKDLHEDSCVASVINEETGTEWDFQSEWADSSFCVWVWNPLFSADYIAARKDINYRQNEKSKI